MRRDLRRYLELYVKPVFLAGGCVGRGCRVSPSLAFLGLRSPEHCADPYVGRGLRLGMGFRLPLWAWETVMPQKIPPETLHPRSLIPPLP